MPNSSSKKAKNNDLGNYMPLKLTLVTGEIMDWVLLEHISGHMEEQMVTGNSKCGFMTTKTCLTTQIGFWDKITGFAGEGRAGDDTYIDFSKGFNTVS